MTLRREDLEPHPAPPLAAMRPGVHVCPWYAPGGTTQVEVVLVGQTRSRIGGIVCPNDERLIEAVRDKLEEVARILEPRPQLKVLA